MRLLLIATAFLVLAACKQNSTTTAKQNTETSYTITGNITGLQKSDLVVLEYTDADMKPDTAVVTGGSFVFKGQANEPLLGFISISDGVSKSYRGVELVVENAKITITGNKDSLALAKVEGGTGNSELIQMEKALKPYHDSLEIISARADPMPQTDVEGFKKVEQEYYNVTANRRKVIHQFAKDHPNSIVSAFYAYQDLAGNIGDTELEAIYNKFDDNIKNSAYGKRIRELLAAARRLEIGNAAPELNLNDANGNPVLISSYKGKVLLIDFWASWCGPCRAENPNVVKAYNRYKQKGFDILGVSLDKDRDAWQNAIRTDNLTWQQVSDLKEWNSRVVPMYGLTSIPANVLVDKEGKVVARDLRGPQLEEKIEELLSAP